jgi:hypothetical protein
MPPPLPHFIIRVIARAVGRYRKAAGHEPAARMGRCPGSTRPRADSTRDFVVFFYFLDSI